MKTIEECTIDFIKFLENKKIKGKTSILIKNTGSDRIFIFRFDILKELLNESDFQKIQAIFKDLIEKEIKSIQDLVELFQILKSKKMILILERSVSKVKTPMYKWPKEMVVSKVG